MKITIDKKAVLLSEVDEAKELIKNESGWIDADVLQYCVREIIENHTGESVWIENVLSMPKLTVCKNRYKLTVYANDMIVKIHTANRGDEIIIISFDVLATYNDGYRGAFVQWFKSAGYGVI